LENKIVGFYHVADLDGKCSGAILKYVFKKNIKLVPFNYNYEIDWSLIDKETIVYAVDISFPKEDMIRMKDSCKQFIWIDHHISKIEELSDYQFDGIRKDGTAACILTWKYLLADKELPDAVSLLGEYDVWNVTPKNLAFQYEMRTHDHSPENQNFWKLLFNDTYFTNRLVCNGEAIYNYVKGNNKLQLESTFLTSYKGYSVLAANKAYCSSLFFEDHKSYNDVDILLAFAWNGKSWKISMYGRSDSVDVSKLCVELGGGGHRKAAGAFLKKLPKKLRISLFGE